jgi:hypothetical protein
MKKIKDVQFQLKYKHNPLGVIIKNVNSSVFCAVERNETSRYASHSK